MRAEKTKTPRVWSGEVTDADRFFAAHDARQLHFFFYEEADPSTDTLNPGKKPPNHVSAAAERVDVVLVRSPLPVINDLRGNLRYIEGFSKR